MKKVSVAVLVLIACLAVGSVGVASAKKQKPKNVQTSISLTVSKTAATTYSPGSGTYSGQVSAGGPSGCRANRPVTITGPAGPVGTVATQSSGAYSLTVASAPNAGTYTASVPQVVVKQGKKGKKKKFICSAATTSASVS